MNDVKICQYPLSHPNGRIDRVALIDCRVNAINPKGILDSIVSRYVGTEGYNEFVEIHLDNPWLRIIIKDINELNFVQNTLPAFLDVEVFEQTLIAKSGNQNGRIAVLRGGLDSDKPTSYMSAAVTSFVGSKLYNEFVEIYLDNPWVRVIIFDINKTEYEPFKNQTINGII